MKKLSILASAVATCVLTTTSIPAFAVEASFSPTFDFHGYLRSGVGVSRDGALAEWNKSYLGRLGNEKDTYGELEFGSKVYELNGVSFYLDTMVSMVSDGFKDDENTENDTANFGLRQLNLQVKGLLPFDKDAVIWGGKRYYQRKDIHIIDTKYLNISGAGAGIENLAIGPGKASFAWIRSDANDLDYRYDDSSDADTKGNGKVNVNVNNIDLRYAFAPAQGLWAEVAAVYAIPTKEDVDKGYNVGSGGDSWTRYTVDNSMFLTAELGFPIGALYNKLILQYGDNNMAHNVVDQGGGWYDAWNKANKATGYRVMDVIDWPVTDNLTLSGVLTYGYAEETAEYVDDISLYQGTVRGSYQISQYARVLAEIGAFNKETTWTSGDSTTDAGQKYALALAFAPAKEILSRPELRFYASYLTADEDSQVPNSSGRYSYSDNFNFGVQVEAWW